MKNKKITVLLAIYLLIITQFVFSNFVSLIGKNYTPSYALTSFHNYEEKHFSSEVINCGAISLNSVPVARHQSNRGFPFATDEVSNLCQDNNYIGSGFQTFNIDRILDFIYVYVITIIALVLYKRIINNKK